MIVQWSDYEGNFFNEKQNKYKLFTQYFKEVILQK